MGGCCRSDPLDTSLYSSQNTSLRLLSSILYLIGFSSCIQNTPDHETEAYRTRWLYRPRVLEGQIRHTMQKGKMC